MIRGISLRCRRLNLIVSNECKNILKKSTSKYLSYQCHGKTFLNETLNFRKTCSPAVKPVECSLHNYLERSSENVCLWRFFSISHVVNFSIRFMSFTFRINNAAINQGTEKILCYGNWGWVEHFLRTSKLKSIN